MTSLMCPLSKEKQVSLSLRMPWALPPPGILAQEYCWGILELPREVPGPQNVSSGDHGEQIPLP